MHEIAITNGSRASDGRSAPEVPNEKNNYKLNPREVTEDTVDE